jgi:hypothetical protein
MRGKQIEKRGATGAGRRMGSFICLPIFGHEPASRRVLHGSVGAHAVGVMVQHFVMPAMVMVRQAQEGDSQADHGGEHQDHENDHERRVNVCPAQVNDVPFAVSVQGDIVVTRPEA